MPFLSRNVSLGAPIRLSSFRKVALGTWRTVGDPSVYSFMDFDVTAAQRYLDKIREKSGLKVTLTHFVGKAAAETIRRHPELNCILRYGAIYPRKSVDIFFQVASDVKGEDLSGMTIRHADEKSIADFAGEMQKKVEDIRIKGDPAFKKMKSTMKLLPAWASRWMISLSGFIMYTLNIWTPLLGVPRDPFGSIMITSIGTIGLEMAFVPLVPYSRVPCLVAVGAVKDTPVVRNGQVAIAPMIRVSVTFDHRIIDGMHASHMARTLKKIFENPEAELGAV